MGVRGKGKGRDGNRRKWRKREEMEEGESNPRTNIN